MRQSPLPRPGTGLPSTKTSGDRAARPAPPPPVSHPGPYRDVLPEAFPGRGSRGYGVLHEHERPHPYPALRDLPPRSSRMAARPAGREAPGVRSLQVHEHEQLRRPLPHRLHGLRPHRRTPGRSSVVPGPNRPAVRALLGTAVGPGAPVVVTRRHASSSRQDQRCPTHADSPYGHLQWTTLRAAEPRGLGPPQFGGERAACRGRSLPATEQRQRGWAGGRALRSPGRGSWG